MVYPAWYSEGQLILTKYQNPRARTHDIRTTNLAIGQGIEKNTTRLRFTMFKRQKQGHRCVANPRNDHTGSGNSVRASRRFALLVGS